MYPYFTLFHAWTAFHCLDILHFFTPFVIFWWIFGLFPLWDIMNNAAMDKECTRSCVNICFQFFWPKNILMNNVSDFFYAHPYLQINIWFYIVLLFLFIPLYCRRNDSYRQSDGYQMTSNLTIPTSSSCPTFSCLGQWPVSGYNMHPQPSRSFRVIVHLCELSLSLCHE